MKKPDIDITSLLTIPHVTFDNLPVLMTAVIRKLDILNQLLEAELNPYLDIPGLQMFLPWHPSKTTIYKYVKLKEIPYRKKAGRLLFLRTEIKEWINETKHRSMENETLST